MRLLLLIQSLSPIALLTIVCNIRNLKLGDNFWNNNIYLMVLFIFCLVWIIFSIISIFFFKCFSYLEENKGFDIEITDTNEDASVTFFISFIFPFLINDFSNWSSIISYSMVLLFLIILLYHSNLFYSNPVLSFLGYKVFKFKFKQNEKESSKELIGIAYKTIPENVNYKKISDKVFCIKDNK